MKNKFWMVTAFVLFVAFGTNAQTKLSVDKVYSAYLRNSGTIMENNQIKGYFFLYLSDKIDKHTNEYTLQILDENVNKVKDIKFQDSKKLNLLEAAYNGNTLSFLFKNGDDKTLDMRIYGLDGTLKYTYTREYDKRTDQLMSMYETMHTDDGTNQNVFDLGKHGYASVLPLRDGKQRTYEVDFYSSEEKKQWTYIPEDDEERYTNAEFLGSTDNLIILEVLKKNRALSNSVNAHLVGINFLTKQKAFDIDNEGDTYTFVPTNVTTENNSGKIMVVGNYFDKNANIIKDASKGIAIYAVDSKGKVLSRTYNSWADDFAKYLPLNKKGKIDNIGYLYTQKVIQAPNGKMFVVGEGYKRQASAGGIALNALSMLGGGGRTNVGVTKIVITDMVIMEFNNQYKVSNATIYDKTNNTAEASITSDYVSQHQIALLLKMTGAFDYDFTTGNPDNSNFSVCYSDWVRSSDYKGETFNSIRYDGSKFTTDKIELKSKATHMKVFPAKPGSVMIMEYFRKEKRLDFRLEKLS
ncbi:MAG: hypothetical protein JWN78_87 [Bacteroidota bacterium]|nr:hypothetical protein [Bacteroidota bacterium]